MNELLKHYEQTFPNDPLREVKTVLTNENFKTNLDNDSLEVFADKRPILTISKTPENNLYITMTHSLYKRTKDNYETTTNVYSKHELDTLQRVLTILRPFLK